MGEHERIALVVRSYRGGVLDLAMEPGNRKLLGSCRVSEAGFIANTVLRGSTHSRIVLLMKSPGQLQRAVLERHTRDNGRNFSALRWYGVLEIANGRSNLCFTEFPTVLDGGRPVVFCVRARLGLGFNVVRPFVAITHIGQAELETPELRRDPYDLGVIGIAERCTSTEPRSRFEETGRRWDEFAPLKWNVV